MAKLPIAKGTAHHFLIFTSTKILFTRKKVLKSSN